MVDLLEQHHRHGRRFEPLEFVEEGLRVAVRLAVTDPRWEGKGETYKIFTFSDEGDELVLLQDCVDRDDALGYLAAG